MEVYVNLRMALHEAPEPWQEPARGKGGQRGDRQHVLVAVAAAYQVGRFSDFAQRAADAIGEVPTRIGQRDAAAIAVKKSRAERALERAYLMADRAVRDGDLFCRAREAAEPRGGLERTKGGEWGQPGSHPLVNITHKRGEKISPLA